MKGKIGGLLVVLLGQVLIVAGLVVKLWLVPMMAVFPDDVDSTRHYEGTLTMLNTQAMGALLADPTNAEAMAALFLRDVPVTIDRHVTTEEVRGNQALVREGVAMYAPTPSGYPGLLQRQVYWYAINRTTTEAVDNFSDNPNATVNNAQEGLVIGFPIGTEPRDYEGWNDDYQDTNDAVYLGVEEVAGLSTYHFRAQSEPKLIVDPAILAMFPAELPRSAIEALAPGLGLDPTMLMGLQMLLPTMPEVIEPIYLYGYESNYWVEPTTGMLIDYTKDETRYMALAEEGPLAAGQIEVFHLVYQATDESIQDAKDEAATPKMLLDLFEWLPWVVIGIGVLVTVGGGFMLTRKRESAAPAAS